MTVTCLILLSVCLFFLFFGNVYSYLTIVYTQICSVVGICGSEVYQAGLSGTGVCKVALFESMLECNENGEVV